MKTRYLIICILVVFSITKGLSQPQEDAVFNRITKEYILLEDGSMVYHYYKKMSLYSHFSFNRLYGETFIVYNPEFQKLTINKAYTTQANGNIVHSPANAFNEVLPHFAQEAPRYNGLREMVVTHTGLEVNSVIELDYTVTSQAGYFPALMGDEIITESSPVEEEVVVIKVPLDSELNFKVYNIRTAPEISEEKNLKIYTFTFRRIREMDHEAMTPGHHSDLPRLVFSTKTMEDVYGFLTGQDSFTYKSIGQAKATVEKLKKEAKDDLEVVLSLQKLVVNELNTFNIPFEHAGFRARGQAETWASNGGTPIEKALLLAGLYREAGINAETVILFPEKFYDPLTGCLPLMTDVLVQVNPRELEQQYVSPVSLSDQNLIYSIPGKVVIPLNAGKPLTLAGFSEIPGNEAVLTGELSLDDSLHLRGNLEALLRGRINPYYRIFQDKENVKGELGGLIGRKDISEYELKNSAQVRSTIGYTINRKEAFELMGDYLQLELPVLTGGFEAWHLNYLSASREAPLEVPFAITEKYNFTITLPSSVKWVGNPINHSLEAGFGSLGLDIREENGTILVKKTIIINEQMIQPSEYPEFKKMVDLYNSRDSKFIYLRLSD